MFLRESAGESHQTSRKPARSEHNVDCTLVEDQETQTYLLFVECAVLSQNSLVPISLPVDYRETLAGLSRCVDNCRSAIPSRRHQPVLNQGPQCSRQFPKCSNRRFVEQFRGT